MSSKHTGPSSYTAKADVTSLDQDLLELRRNKFSRESVDEISQWIFGAVLKEPIPSDLLAALKDSTALCRLANTLYAADAPNSGALIKYKESRMPFVQMEQISQFLAFARQYGVPEDELFQTVDLYEEKDPAVVYQALKSLSRYANKKHPQQFPVIGPQIATKRPRPPKATKPKHLQGSGWSTLEYGYIKGANQSSEGVVFGQKRDITR
ncbi:LAQU0S01e15940g1_1 [Lachancea quebecensis]|uniref:LAQU0S01e15940g1_1 n=1 Tax=Lachancea quebecensis TaxID=1654605 RepID=A0A0P1KNQ5_9SACH|nr:LAQU0S01e15940g1_1 [Lachancea quebecensis]